MSTSVFEPAVRFLPHTAITQNPVALESIVRSAQRQLSRSPYRELRMMRVWTDEYQLMIEGHASTFFFKQLAQEAVRQVVRKIDSTVRISNLLEVNS